MVIQNMEKEEAAARWAVPAEWDVPAERLVSVGLGALCGVFVAAACSLLRARASRARRYRPVRFDEKDARAQPPRRAWMDEPAQASGAGGAASGSRKVSSEENERSNTKGSSYCARLHRVRRAAADS